MNNENDRIWTMRMIEYEQWEWSNMNNENDRTWTMRMIKYEQWEWSNMNNENDQIWTMRMIKYEQWEWSNMNNENDQIWTMRMIEHEQWEWSNMNNENDRPMIGQRLSDRFAEHRSSRNNADVDKPVARHFNTANHSISDINICTISPISIGNDSRRRQVKRLIFKIGIIHPHGLNERFSFIWSIHSFCFCPACADKSGDFSPFHSIV